MSSATAPASDLCGRWLDCAFRARGKPSSSAAVSASSNDATRRPAGIFKPRLASNCFARYSGIIPGASGARLLALADIALAAIASAGIERADAGSSSSASDERASLFTAASALNARSGDRRTACPCSHLVHIRRRNRTVLAQHGEDHAGLPSSAFSASMINGNLRSADSALGNDIVMTTLPKAESRAISSSTRRYRPVSLMACAVRSSGLLGGENTGS